MSLLSIHTLCVGPLAVNCYIVGNSETGAALVVDPGDDASDIVAAVRESGLSPRGILLTHGHFDHIRGVRGVTDAFGIPVYLDAADRDLYFSPRNAMPPVVGPARGLPAIAPVPPSAPGLSFEILPTPGHTPGGVGYYFPAANALFSGDTLFAGSVGRTDFPGGDAKALLGSIRKVLFALPGDVRVYPGHGGPTTIAVEQRSNPFVR